MREQRQVPSIEEIREKFTAFDSRVKELVAKRGRLKPYKDGNCRLWVGDDFEVNDGLPSHFFVITGEAFGEEPKLDEHCVDFAPINSKGYAATFRAIRAFASVVDYPKPFVEGRDDTASKMLKWIEIFANSEQPIRSINA